MKTMLKAVTLAGVAAVLFGAAATSQSPIGVAFVPEAQAIIGLPFTPLSFAGVARRTAYRTIAYTDVAAVSAMAASSAAAANVAAADAAAYRPPPPPPSAPVAAPAPAPVAAPSSAPAPATVPAAPAAAPGAPLPLGTIVQVLPAGCTSTPVGGQEYFYCGGNFYRPAFSGNNLVYVTAQP